MIKVPILPRPGRRLRGGVRRRLRCAVSVVLLLTALPLRAALLVELLIDAESAAQGTIVESLEASLAEPGPAPVVRLRVQAYESAHLPPAGGAAPDAPDLYVSLGSRAAHWLAQQEVAAPRLFAFIPRAVWYELRDCCLAVPGDDSALLIDRPLGQQLRLVKALVPGARRVAVLLGPASSSERPALEAAAEVEALALAIGQVDAGESVGPVLRGLVESADALLALPDPAVFNRETLYPILLTTYSAMLPLVGFSEPMVRAGAAAALHLTFEDAGSDLAQAILRFGRLRQLAPPGASPSSSLAVNREVLRSLRIRVDADALLEQVLAEDGR